MRFVEGVAAGAGFLLVALAVMPDALARRLAVRNYRGVPVPAVLGPALAAVAVLVPALSNAGHAAWGRPFGQTPWRVVVALAVVVGAGLLDDLAAHGPRGIRAHLKALAAGRPTTGIFKRHFSAQRRLASLVSWFQTSAPAPATPSSKTYQ